MLASRSPVMRTMFITNMEEKRQSRVELSDIEVEVFEELLRYVYTDAVPDLEKYGTELFEVPDKV